MPRRKPVYSSPRRYVVPACTEIRSHGAGATGSQPPNRQSQQACCRTADLHPTACRCRPGPSCASVRRSALPQRHNPRDQGRRDVIRNRNPTQYRSVRTPAGKSRAHREIYSPCWPEDMRSHGDSPMQRRKTGSRITRRHAGIYRQAIRRYRQAVDRRQSADNQPRQSGCGPKHLRSPRQAQIRSVNPTSSVGLETTPEQCLRRRTAREECRSQTPPASWKLKGSRQGCRDGPRFSCENLQTPGFSEALDTCRSGLPHVKPEAIPHPRLSLRFLFATAVRL